jgi:hypothetical protein
VAIDRGVITVVVGTNGGYTCTEAHTAGPDAAAITVTAETNGCVISGLSATNPFEVTPDGTAQQTASNPNGTSSVAGGTGGAQGYTAYVAAQSSSSLLIGYEVGGVPGTPADTTGSGIFNGTYDWAVILPS